MLEVIYEDNHLIAINKKSGDISQGDKTGDLPLSDYIKEYLKKKYKDFTIKVVDDGSKEYDDMWMDLEVKINKQSNADKETVSVANRIANGEKITYPF